MIDIERSDYLRTPGHRAVLTIGPLTFAVDTADGGAVCFTVRLGRFDFYWGGGQ